MMDDKSKPGRKRTGTIATGVRRDTTTEFAAGANHSDGSDG